MPSVSTQPAREPLLAPGQIVGSHRVERLVGRGGLAEVYLVTELSMGVQQALKLLVDVDQAMAQRLFREGRAQYLVQHANILRVFSSLTVQGRPALLMEYVDGPDLRRWLGRQRRAGSWPSLELSLELFHQILDGMEAAHEAGLVHRDLKPGNIMLELERSPLRPRITDFGLVKEVHRVEEDREVTSVGTMMGTRGYSAPEQLWGLPEIDARADVYSLGCILYLLACGRPPFEGKHELSIMRRVFNDEYLDPQEVAPGLPTEVAMAIRHCMAAERRDRLPSCAALRAVLQGGSSALLGMGLAPRALPPLRRSPQVVDPRSRAPDSDGDQTDIGLASMPPGQASSPPQVPSMPPLASSPTSSGGLAPIPSEFPSVGSEASLHVAGHETQPPTHVSSPPPRAAVQRGGHAGSSVRWALVGAVVAVGAMLCVALVAVPAVVLWRRGASTPPQVEVPAVQPAPGSASASAPTAPASPGVEVAPSEEPSLARAPPASPLALAQPGEPVATPPAPAAVQAVAAPKLVPAASTVEPPTAPGLEPAPSPEPVPGPESAPSPEPVPGPESAPDPEPAPSPESDPALVSFRVRGIDQKLCLQGVAGGPAYCSGRAPPGRYDILLHDGAGASFIAGQVAIETGKPAVISCDAVFQTCF